MSKPAVVSPEVRAVNAGFTDPRDSLFRWPRINTPRPGNEAVNRLKAISTRTICRGQSHQVIIGRMCRVTEDPKSAPLIAAAFDFRLTNAEPHDPRNVENIKEHGCYRTEFIRQQMTNLVPVKRFRRAPIQAKSITRKTTAQINQVSKNLDIGFLRFRFG